MTRGDCVRSVPLIDQSIDGERVVVYMPLTREIRVLPRRLLDTLRLCSEFAPLSVHAASIRLHDPERFNSANSAEAILIQLHRAGFFVSPSEIARGCVKRTGNNDVCSTGISTIGWVTGGRPDSLRESVSSFERICTMAEREIELVICDDAADEDESSRAKAALRLGIQGVRAVYFPRRAKFELAKELASLAGCSEEISRFALFGDAATGRSIGANRNALLLLTVGRQVLSVDDDIVATVQFQPGLGNDSSLCFRSGDPYEMRFFGTRDEALRAASTAQVDVVAEHEAVLSATLEDLVVRFAGPAGPKFEDPCTHLQRGLSSNFGRVAVTFSGILGDSGMSSSSRLLFSQGATRAVLLQSEEYYRRALVCREVVRVARETAISHGGPCFMGCAGLDNRDLLPPFMPALRGEDGIFGVMVSRLMCGAYFGYLPFALLHTGGSTGRAYTPDSTCPRNLIRFCDLIVSMVGSIEERDGEMSAAALTRAGRVLADIGAMSRQAFTEYLSSHAVDMARRSIALLTDLARRHPDSPRFWIEDIEERMGHWQAVITNPDDALPYDVPGDKVETARRLILKFGLLLQAWPAMVEGAKQKAATRFTWPR